MASKPLLKNYTEFISYMKIENLTFVVKRVIEMPDLFLMGVLVSIPIELFNELSRREVYFKIERKQVIFVANCLILTNFNRVLVGLVEQWACFIKFGAPISWNYPNNQNENFNRVGQWQRIDISRWDEEEFNDIFSCLEDLSDSGSIEGVLDFARRYKKENVFNI